jgi:uncharacterized protein involved in exopolysaccharide biosynthesis
MIEKDSLQKQLKDVRADSIKRIDSLSRRNEELEADLHQIKTQNNIYSGQSKNYKDLEGEFRQAQVDLKAL